MDIVFCVRKKYIDPLTPPKKVNQYKQLYEIGPAHSATSLHQQGIACVSAYSTFLGITYTASAEFLKLSREW